MLDVGYIIGWLGVLFGLVVPLPQLRKMVRTRSLGDISLGTYGFLVLALICYLVHAIYIHSLVFTVTQSLNLITNGIILVLLIRHKIKGGLKC